MYNTFKLKILVVSFLVGLDFYSMKEVENILMVTLVVMKVKQVILLILRTNNMCEEFDTLFTQEFTFKTFKEFEE